MTIGSGVNADYGDNVIPTPKGARLPCGCHVDIEGDEIHVHPCCDEHEPVLATAARNLAAAHGIPCDG